MLWKNRLKDGSHVQDKQAFKEHLMMNDPMNPLNVVRSFFNAMEKMDFDTGLRFVADELVYVNGPKAPVKGPGGVRAELEPFFAPVDENQFIIQSEAASGNRVFIERLDRHRIAQSWFELPVTGVLEVKGGKIVYWREYFDLQTVVDGMTRAMQGAR
jgi:limonene-1,2-epoxide hydrolase